MTRRFPLWGYALCAALLVAGQITALHVRGQPLTAPDGIRLWESDIFSPRMSQEISDWYSFSHIVHGFLFYGLLHLVARRLPVAARLLIAMGIEISWEIAENSPYVINAYRQQALAAGYTGDSILNSVMDTVMMAFGFFLASRLRVRTIVALGLALEIFAASMVRDNFALNVLNFAVPLKSVHDWQAGKK